MNYTNMDTNKKLEFSEEDMIEFALFYFKHQGKSLEYWGKDLFKVWKEQQPKIIYYE